MNRSPLYTLLFVAAVCAVCGLLVSSAAVVLADAQARNRAIDRDRSVLEVAGLVGSDQRLADGEIKDLFEARIRQRALRLGTADAIDDTEVALTPGHGSFYEVLDDGRVVTVVLPVEGQGLWSTMRGFIAIDADGATIRGISFHEHQETPGLGGEIDSARWRARWLGRKAFDTEGRLRLTVVKGPVGSPTDDPHRVDAISGATITSDGVGAMVASWLGDERFGPYLAKMRTRGGR